MIRGEDEERGPIQRGVAAICFYLGLLGFGLAVDPGWGAVAGEVDQVLARVGPAKGAVYAAGHLASVFGLSILLLTGGLFRRLLVWTAVVLGSVLEVGLRAINGDGYELWEARLFASEAGMMDEAFRTYSGLFVSPLAWIVASALALEFLRGRFVGSLRGGWILTGIAILLGVAGPFVVIERTEGRSSVFPAFFKFPVVTVLAHLPDGMAGSREAPRLDPRMEEGAYRPRHLILVVDESVRGDVLAVNGGTLVPTPFLSGEAPPYLNYGVACSGTNSSAPSNILLQTGVRPELLMSDPHLSEREATIFQYARHSGHRTALLAGQVVKSWYYVSAFDLAAIDHYRGLRESRQDVSDAQIDRVLIDEALAFLEASPDGGFAYLLKMGAHFPYVEKHPEEVPGPPADVLGRETDARRRAKLGRYGRAVRWASDDFLRTLLTRLEGTDTVVVYTSDHGQSILEGGIEGTHGVYRDPPASQANVPLMVFGTNARSREALQGLAAGTLAGGRDHMTHFEIFPTLLELLGYAREDVREAFGPGLFEEPAERRRRFFSGDPFKTGLRMLNDFD